MNGERFRELLLAEIDRLAEIHGHRKVYPKVCRMSCEHVRLLLDEAQPTTPAPSYTANLGVRPAGSMLNIDGVWIVPDDSVAEPVWEEATNASA